MVESILQGLVFAIAGIVGFITLLLPWIAIDRWGPGRSSADREDDHSDAN